MSKTALWRAAAATAAIGLVIVARLAWAGPADDDLAVVKKAVSTPAQVTSTPEAKAVPEGPGARKGEPQWLKVRVNEKGAKKAKVIVNLPLALVHALGDDWPMDWRCRHKNGERCSIKISEVLMRLQSGQDIVEIEDED